MAILPVVRVVVPSEEDIRAQGRTVISWVRSTRGHLGVPVRKRRGVAMDRIAATDAVRVIDQPLASLPISAGVPVLPHVADCALNLRRVRPTRCRTLPQPRA